MQVRVRRGSRSLLLWEVGVRPFWRRIWRACVSRLVLLLGSCILLLCAVLFWVLVSLGLRLVGWLELCVEWAVIFCAFGVGVEGCVFWPYCVWVCLEEKS